MATRYTVPKPCDRRWQELDGEGRARFCDTCKTHVHAISEYSPEAWEKLWRDSGGHVCGLLPGESAPEPRSRRAVLVGAMLTVISPLMAQTGRVRIVVLDPSRALIPKASVELLDKDSNPVRTQLADESGVSRWSELPMGDSKFRVVVPGFKMKPLVVTIKNGDEVVVEAMLEPGAQGGVIRVEIPQR